MNSKKWYQLLGCFLKEYRFSSAIFFLFSGIFAGIFSLYNLEVEAVLYAVCLCLLVAIFVLGFKFHFYVKQYRQRQRFIQNIELDYDKLPEGFTLAEKDYINMIRRLGEINMKNLTESKSKEQEKMDYYTTWVHQIKTPISVMQMMLQSEDTSEHRELSAELFRIEQYVEMVLSYLRLGSNSTDYVFRVYDLDSVIKQAIHKYASQFIRKKIRLIYEPTGEKVLTDEKWLLFILEQLLSNALKYTHKGSITITVTENKVLEISDTGIGIEAEDIPRIFEKGFTGFNGRADKKSTGLGLYLCKKAAKKLSINIMVDSIPNRGTTFFLDLKLKEVEVE